MTKNDLQIVAKFCVLLFVLLTGIYFCHTWLLEQKQLTDALNSPTLIKAYLFNGIFTTIVFTALIYLKKKYMASLGFFFLGGSMIKIIFFFILFRPSYALDGIISKIEFSEFFTPYGVCLFFEVFYLVKLLMKE